MADFYQVLKNDGHVMIHAHELDQYLQEGWVVNEEKKPSNPSLEEPAPENPKAPSLTEWVEMIKGIKGEGAITKLNEIADQCGITLGTANIHRCRSLLINAYSKQNS